MTLISQEWLSNFLSPFFSFCRNLHRALGNNSLSIIFVVRPITWPHFPFPRVCVRSKNHWTKNQSSRVMAEWNPQSHIFPWGKKLTTVFFSPSFSLLIYCRHFPIQWLRSCPPDNNCCCLNQSVVNHIINPSQLVNTLWLWLLLLFPLPLSVRSISLYARRSTDLT